MFSCIITILQQYTVYLSCTQLCRLSTHHLSQLMRLWYLSHRRPVKAQASLRICAVSPQPSLFAHMKYGSRQRVRPKIRYLAPLDGCTCAFEEWVYGGQKGSLFHNMAHFILPKQKKKGKIKTKGNIWLTLTGKCLSGCAAIPVMKSFVINVRITIDLWHDGWCNTGSLSKCIGMITTGIWLSFEIYPESCNTDVALKSACRSVLSTPSDRYVGVMSSIGNLTGSPNMYTTLKYSRMRKYQRTSLENSYNQHLHSLWYEVCSEIIEALAFYPEHTD